MHFSPCILQNRARRMSSGPKTVAILGAGFSYVAGLPLTKDLFDVGALVASRRANNRFTAVRAAWRHWREKWPSDGPEQFLRAINDGREQSVPWEWAVELVAASLATPRGDDWPVIEPTIRGKGHYQRARASSRLFLGPRTEQVFAARRRHN